MGLIVDNFAGGGGASTGLERALERTVDIAINHNRHAIAMHRLNHPGTLHLETDVWDVDPIEVTKGQPVDICWFSPDCTFFSRARGGKPVNNRIRGLAWVALRWAALKKPKVIFLENVREFETWGPLKRKGKRDKKRQGETFLKFIGQLRGLGYDVEWKPLVACHFGAATRRERLYLIARCDGRPIVWPEAERGEEGGQKPFRTTAEHIDWSQPCPSIFTRKKELALSTKKRLAKGIVKFVIEAKKPFVIPVSHGDSPGCIRPGIDPAGPMHTLTAVNQFAVVDATVAKASFLTEHANASLQRNMSVEEPSKVITAHPKGGSFALVSAFLAKHYTGVIGTKLETPVGAITSIDHHSLVVCHMDRWFGQSIGYRADEPAGAITAGGGGNTSLVTSHIMKLRGTNIGHETDAPIHTISAGGTHHAEVRAFLTKYYGALSAGARLDEPAHTIRSGDTFGLVTVTIAGEPWVIVDIGMRMLTPRELYRLQGFPDSYIIEYGIDENGDKITFSQKIQVKLVGNSVCPDMSYALARANCTNFKAKTRAA